MILLRFLKIYPIILLFTAHSYWATAQDPPQVIPPSPTAASFSKYTEMPVSTYTGLPNITVPIYEIVSKDIKIPINLSYHAGGIKVDEEASWVGLGWTLNTNGAITRTVIGRDDFNPAFNYFDPNVLSLPKGYAPKANFSVGCTANFYDNITADVQQIDFSPYIRANYNDPYEFEADQYTFNFPGHSGKFMLQRNYQAILTEQKKLAIQCDPPGKSWTITTDDGFRYIFDKYESYTDYYISDSVRTAWYLTKIISTTGEEVTFHYDEDKTFTRPVGSVYEENRFQGTTGSRVPTTAGDPPACYVAPVFRQIEQKSYKNVTLSYIDFQHGRVVFDYNSDRLDLDGGKRLNRIQIFKKATDGTLALQPFKEYEFAYEYFEGIGDDDITHTNGLGDYLSKRLKLVSLQEKSASDNAGAYVFTYYEGNTLNDLPCKASFARDHWGYFNGVFNNTTLIPEFRGVLDGVFEQPQYVELEGANREPNEQYAKAFTLKTIQYPTGGSTTFDYEVHTFDLEKSIVNDDSPAPLERYIDQKEERLLCNTFGTVVTRTLDISKGYLPEGKATVEVTMDAVFRLSNPGASTPISSRRVYFELYRPTGARESMVDITDATCDSTSLVCTYNNTYHLAPGVYTWKAYMADESDIRTNLQEIRANYHWEENRTFTQEKEDIYQAGGLRISTMITRDGLDASKDMHRKFVYHYQMDIDSDGTEETFSHGRRMARPIYAYFRDHYDTYTEAGYSIDYQCFWFIRSAISNVPLNGTALGSVVGYDEVTVLYGKDGYGNYGMVGKTVYQYENHPDVILNYNFSRPPGIANLTSPRNGLLKKQADYAFHQGDYRIVRENINNYSPSKNQQTVYAVRDEDITYASNVTADCNYYLYFYPTFRSEWIQLGSTIERVYDLHNPATRVETVTRYQYETNPVHYQMKSVTTIDSRSRNHTTQYMYAADYADNTQGSNLLRDRHIHSQRLVSETSIASSAIPISKTLKAFSEVDSDDPTIKYACPTQVTTYPDGQSEKAAVKMLYSYDMYGNIIQVKKENDIPTAYIWGYNHSRPVAQVVGATYTDAVAKVNFSLLQTMDGQNLRTELDNLRTLPQALVTTYTYDPMTSLTSVTDPSGLTTHYEYDDLQRLKVIKDFQGHKLSQYKYQYSLPK